MWVALLLGLFSFAQAFLHENFNGIVDGNACTGTIPSTTSSIIFQAPTNTSVGQIGVRQIAFQTVGTWYTFSGSVLLNGITGTYMTNCCPGSGCDADTYATNPFSECGLTWCGEENQWVYVDFTSTSLYTNGLVQNGTANLTFTIPIQLADDGLGNPMYSLSYVLVPPSQSPSSTLSPSRTQTGSRGPTPSSFQTLTETSSPSASPFSTLSVTLSHTGSEASSSSISSSPTPSRTGSESISPSNTLSVSPSTTGSETESLSSTLSVTQSRTASESISPSNTLSQTVTGSESPSFSRSPSQIPSQSATKSESPSSSRSPSQTLSVAPSPSVTASESGTRLAASSSSSGTRSPSISPSGICYSVVTQYGTTIVLSGGWIIVNTGINVTQAYGSGYISMGTFASCSVIGSTCRCSYTQGSTVAGCSGKRNSYITYSYGATTDITYTNESPTCSYNFAGTIGIPPSITQTPTLTPTLSRSISRSVLPSSSFTPSRSQTRSESPLPTSTPLTRPVLIADSAIDFPSVQGQNGWYYNYYDVANVLRPMPFYGTNTLIVTGSYWQIQNSVCVIGSTLLHPAHSSNCATMFQGNCKPTVFWNNTYSNNNTLYIVSYTAAHPTNYPGTNGVKITLKYNDLVLHSVSPTFTITQTNYSIYNLSSLEVSLDPLAHCDSDSSTYNLKIYQYQIYPSTSASPTSTLSPSITTSATLSLSQTRTGSGSRTGSHSLSPSESGSTSESPSSTPTSSPSQTGGASSSSSRSLSPSESPSTSESPSSTPTSSQTQTGSESSTGSSSLTGSRTSSTSESPSFTLTPSQTRTGSVSGTESLSFTASRTHSESGSQTRGPSRTPTHSKSGSLSSTITTTASDSPTFSPSMIYITPTSTPLIYCIPYPSSTPTAESTPTSTPLYFITRYPSNATASASTSPFFMMIPYASTTPSSAPVSNQTLVTAQIDITGIAIGSTGIGLAGIGGLLALLRYMRPRLDKAKDQDPEIVIVQEEQDKLAHICVNPADLLEITQLLQALKKEFTVIEPRYT